MECISTLVFKSANTSSGISLILISFLEKRPIYYFRHFVGIVNIDKSFKIAVDW